MKLPKTLSLVWCCCMTLATIASTPTETRAGTIIKTTASFSQTVDVRFDGTTFATLGAIGSGISFHGALDSVINNLNYGSGSIKIDGVTVAGPSRNPVPGVAYTVQDTFGGQFEIRNTTTNDLLLTGKFAEGRISFAEVLSTSPGSFKSTKPITFTGGSLLQYIEPIGSFSLSLTEVLFDSKPPVALNLLNAAPSLTPFRANLTAQLSASPKTTRQVPEPGSLAIFLPILMGGVFRRRQRS